VHAIRAPHIIDLANAGRRSLNRGLSLDCQ